MIVESDHLPNSVTVRTALTPATLQTLATVRIESSSPQRIVPILAALRATTTRPDDRPADLRYAVVFRDRRGKVTQRIYLDAFGRRGVVAGHRVRLCSDALLRALFASFPRLSR